MPVGATRDVAGIMPRPYSTLTGPPPHDVPGPRKRAVLPMVSTCRCFARPGILGRRSPRGVKISPHFGPGDCETSFRREVPREATSSRPRSACFLVSTLGVVIQLHHFARPAWVPNSAGSSESAFNDVACATPFGKVGHRETSYSSWPSVNGATFFFWLFLIGKGETIANSCFPSFRVRLSGRASGSQESIRQPDPHWNPLMVCTRFLAAAVVRGKARRSHSRRSGRPASAL